MILDEVVELSRWQFALTAMYHFLFVPLTLGLSFILAIMESLYVMTDKTIYRDMTKFWGKLFGINFALGVTTGIAMEFQFGTNWSYYSHYVGDIFGAPLALEGLMAFFLESTFVGMFFFGWERFTKRQHLAATWLMALGTNLSALWILIANGWMQNPVGSVFNFETMRMEMTNFAQVIFNPVAQVKFVHTVAAGYVTGAMFVLAISSYYILKKRDLPFARRSFAIAASFGMASVLSVMVLGDESGYEIGEVQRVKLAAIEAEWHTDTPPAAFTIVGLPDQQAEETHYAVKVPYLMGIIATRSFSQEVTGLKDLMKEHEAKIRRGMKAYGFLQKLRAGDRTPENIAEFEKLKGDLGYGLLLKRFTNNVVDATEAQIQAATKSSIPHVAPIFWSFRVMVAFGVIMLVVFTAAFWQSTKHKIAEKKWVLKAALYSLPLPWLAIEAGWFVAEYGRQPWTISGILPTHMSASTLNPSDIWFSIIMITLFYTVLLVVEVYLMRKYIKIGPSSLKTGRYHFEESQQSQNIKVQEHPHV